jgi:hypothetical protein
LPFTFKPEKEAQSVINAEIMEAYLKEIVVLLQVIFNQEIAFEEKVN